MLLTLVVGFVLISALLAGSGLSARIQEQHEAGPLMGPKVAIVSVSGTIAGREVEHVIRQLRQARADERVRAVVLRVDSPGGTLSGSDEIWREVRTVQAKGKPVVASLGGMAASGGYYVATPCDLIMAEPTSLTGSIGVLMELPELGGLLEKVGVRMETLTTGPWKDSPSMFRPLNATERERWQGMIAKGLDRFVRVIAQGRKLDESTVRNLADGRVFTADEARDARLIDRIGYLDDALLEAQKRASLPEANIVRYSESRSLIETLFNGRWSGESPLAELTSWISAGPQLLMLAR
jgi:protease-4